MIKIAIPKNNIEERRYIIDIIFDEFLGLKYQLIEEQNIKNWELQLNNGNKIIIEDHFFNKYSGNLEYLKIENIPLNINFVENEFILENNIPVIYGNGKFENLGNIIICGIDIFSSSFFMLTRWEEYVNKIKDKHNRFPATESIALKNNFLNRPIVNEYVSMLKNMLIKLDDTLVMKERHFSFVLTHDVDFIYKWDNFKKIVRHLIADILIRKSPIEFFKSLYNYFLLKLKLKKDPFDTFDYLMNLSDTINVKSHFFFMAKGLTKYDNNYKSNEEKVIELVKRIKEKGHYIGIHPSYNAYNDNVQFEKEKKELEINFNQKINIGREHFLRFEVPITWQIWEDNLMKWDSTCGYADKEGFKSGVCYEYSVFNILTRKKLKLKEKPLILMETSLLYQKDIDYNIAKSNIENLINIVKKYEGDFVLLWHNSNFNIYEWKRYRKLYEEIIFSLLR